jgi:hypothetical protein
MMQLAVPKQNGYQKYDVHLDIGANERRGSRFSISSPTQGNSCDEFLEPGAKPLTTVKVISC